MSGRLIKVGFMGRIYVELEIGLERWRQLSIFTGLVRLVLFSLNYNPFCVFSIMLEKLIIFEIFVLETIYVL